MDELELMVSYSVLIFFSIWFSIIMNRVRGMIDEKDDVHERLDEAIHAVNTVAELLNQLPNLMPQFALNQNEGVAEKLVNSLIESVFGPMSQPLKTEKPRNADGTYGSPTKEIQPPQIPETNGEGFTGS